MTVYFLIILFATIVGAGAGMGGGVIIKPTLDMISDYNVVTISFLSSITVFSMAIVSTVKQIRNGFKINKTIVTVTIGAVFGGILGSQLFGLVKDNFDPSTVTIIQSVILIMLLMFCLFYHKVPQCHIKSLFGKAVVGLVLGMLSSFLGIGGGPINVAALCVFIGTELRISARISVFIILFAQFSGLITKALSGMIGMVEDFKVLLVMIPAAIIGGLIGSQLNIKLSDKMISYLFRGAVILVICICTYNIVNLILV